MTPGMTIVLVNKNKTIHCIYRGVLDSHGSNEYCQAPNGVLYMRVDSTTWRNAQSNTDDIDSNYHQAH